MIVDELRSLQERAREVEGHRATRLAEVHARIVRVRRRRAAVTGAVVAMVVLGVVALAAQPEHEGAATPADRVPPPAASDTSGVPKVGYPGLPPVGATPSRPGAAELVLHYRGPGTSGGWAEAWVWADGRFIAQWHDILSTETVAAPNATGYVERRLSASGVEALRSYALDPGHPPPRSGDLPFAALLKARQDERLVRLWPNTLIPDRLLGPESWLPETAWVDPIPRPYVASRFAVCQGAGATGRALPTSVVAAELPDAVTDRLSASRQDDGAPGLGCTVVTTGDARTMAAALDQAWLDRDDHRPFLVDVGWVRRASAFLRESDADAGYVGFYAVLPDGRITCTNCG